MGLPVSADGISVDGGSGGLGSGMAGHNGGGSTSRRSRFCERGGRGVSAERASLLYPRWAHFVRKKTEKGKEERSLWILAEWCGVAWKSSDYRDKFSMKG